MLCFETVVLKDSFQPKAGKMHLKDKVLKSANIANGGWTKAVSFEDDVHKAEVGSPHFRSMGYLVVCDNSSGGDC